MVFVGVVHYCQTRITKRFFPSPACPVLQGVAPAAVPNRARCCSPRRYAEITVRAPRYPIRRRKGTKGLPISRRRPDNKGFHTIDPIRRGGYSGNDRTKPLLVPPRKRRLDQPRARHLHDILKQYQRFWGDLASSAGSVSSARWQKRPLGSAGRVGGPGGGVRILGGVKEYCDAAQALCLATRRAAAG